MLDKDDKYLMVSARTPKELVKLLNAYAYEGYRLIKISDEWLDAIMEKID